MEKIRPMLFTTLKKYSGAQLMSDVVAGIIVAIIALPLSIALALASGVGPDQGIYTAIAAGFVISFRGQSGTDCRSNGGICNDRGRYCGEERRGRAGNCNDHGRYHPGYHGILPFWFTD